MSALPIDTRTTIRAPEGFELAYRVAGPARRALAFGVDAAIRAAVLALVWLVQGELTADEAIELITSKPWALAGLSIVYHFAFELAFSGRTPGKKLFGLRAIQTNGAPLDMRSCLIRNGLRLVDLGGLVGLWALLDPASMFVDARFRRIGDRLARSMVVFEAFDDVNERALRPASRLTSHATRQIRERCRRLGALLTRLESGRSAPENEVRELASLMRSLRSDAYRARIEGVHPTMAQAVSSLARRAHQLSCKRDAADRSLLRCVNRVPATVRHHRRSLLLATLTWTLAIGVGALVSESSEPFALSLIDHGPLQSLESAVRGLEFRAPTEIEPFTLRGPLAPMARAEAAVVSFVAGGFVGLGSILALVSDGLEVGTFISHARRLGLVDRAVTPALPSAIFSCLSVLAAATGGLVLGRALLFPGRPSRIQALLARATEIWRLLALSAGLGAFAFAVSRWEVGLTASASLGVLIVGWLAIAGRARPIEAER
ncbi:MAG: RDD family protein [Deltaproteobacteria bacterium]|nr:RDD family protein [Deltaproteobacteria bacterium]